MLFKANLYNDESGFTFDKVECDTVEEAIEMLELEGYDVLGLIDENGNEYSV